MSVPGECDVLWMIHAVASLAGSCHTGSDVKTGRYEAGSCKCTCLRSLMIRHHLLVGFVGRMKVIRNQEACVLLHLPLTLKHKMSSVLKGVMK